MKFSVIIAAHNEGLQIGASLKRLREISRQGPLEVIVVDGGSDDDTVERAREWSDGILVVKDGQRGARLHEGARKATGDILFFLRADAQPPGDWQRILEAFWLGERRQKVAATAFEVDYGAESWLKLSAAVINARARMSGVALWDHGISTTPEAYARCGGIPPRACFDDLGFCEGLAKIGGLAVLPQRIFCAARDLRRQGLVRSALGRGWGELAYRFES